MSNHNEGFPYPLSTCYFCGQELVKTEIDITMVAYKCPDHDYHHTYNLECETVQLAMYHDKVRYCFIYVIDSYVENIPKMRVSLSRKHEPYIFEGYLNYPIYVTQDNYLEKIKSEIYN